MENTLYLVTGAAGFLGSTTCRQLVREGKKVRGFVLPNDPAAKYLPEEVEIVYGDLCNKEDVEKFFTVSVGTETLCLHIASIVTVTPEFNQKVVDVNVGGTNNIIDAVLAHPECKKLVYCSSTGAIPEAPKGTPIKEVYKFEPEKLIDCYSQTKVQATQNVLDAVKERGLHACVVHPSGILGPEDFSISETTGTLIKIIHGEMPAGIDGSFNLSDVRDLANAEITFKEFCKLIVAESGCKPIKFFLPIKLAYTFGKLAEWHAKRTGTKALMTTFSVYNLARNNTFDYSKAKEELGYTTRPCAETVRDEIAWLKKENKI